MEAVTLRHVDKSYTTYGTEVVLTGQVRPSRTRQVLRDVSVSFPAGALTAIVGRSGCGKSTLLRILCGLETADDGTVERRGAPVTGPGADCGMVFQDHRLLSWLTVADNVAFGLRQVPRAQKRALVAEYLNLVGLADYAKSYPAQLSGGMAQRAAIARSLVTKPEILLLDEPFAALDALTRIQMQQEVRRLQASSGITMVLVTHDIDEAVYLGDRIVVMSARPGRIAEILPVPAEAHANRSGAAFAACKERVLAHFFGAEADR